jgi:hypothetical protein
MGMKAPKSGGGDQPQAIRQLRVQSSAYGIVIPLLYGTQRLAANLLWVDGFKAHESHAHSGSAKGGRVTEVSFTYTASVILGLCEGPAYSLGFASASRANGSVAYEPGIWKIKKAMFPLPGLGTPHAGFWPFSGRGVGSNPGAWPTSYQLLELWPLAQGILVSASPGSPVAADLNAGDGSTIYWSHLYYHFGPGNGDEHLAYPGIAYVAGKNVPLDSNASLPNFNFPVIGLLPYFQTYGLAPTHESIFDADPAQIAVDLLTNAAHGAGFPVASLADWFTGANSFSTYCRAAEIFLSPLYDSQRPASQALEELTRQSNSAVVWSEGLLKVIPYGDTELVSTRTGVSYTPDLAVSDPTYSVVGAQINARYDLADDDFLRDSADVDPVIITRTPLADTYNTLQVEWLDRQNGYAPSIAEAKDSAGIATGPVRVAPAEQAHAICDQQVARDTAQRYLQRAIAVRNQYKFHLGWEFVLLEPMDVVTLTDATCGLTQTPVRITAIVENEQGTLAIEAEDLPVGVHSIAPYASQVGTGTSVDYNAPPGSMHPPVLFEAPMTLTGGALALLLVVSGGTNWGGCTVWLSEDGAAYRHVAVVDRAGTHGFLVSSLAAQPNPDTVTAPSLALWNAAVLPSQTSDQASALQGILYIGRGDAYELVAPTTATFLALASGMSFYTLPGTKVRGAHQTPITAHTVNDAVALLNDAAVAIPLESRLIGSTVFLKLLPFNTFGAGSPDLSTIDAIPWTITGAPLLGAVPNVVNAREAFDDGRASLEWDAVTDPRGAVEYEVRRGATWDTAQTEARTIDRAFRVLTAGTYWIAARLTVQAGLTTLVGYSPVPLGVAVSDATLVENVVVTRDFAADGWPGASGGFVDAVLSRAPFAYFRMNTTAVQRADLSGHGYIMGSSGVALGASLVAGDGDAALRNHPATAGWLGAIDFGISVLRFYDQGFSVVFAFQRETTGTNQMLLDASGIAGIGPQLLFDGATNKLKLASGSGSFTALAPTALTDGAVHVLLLRWVPDVAGVTALAKDGTVEVLVDGVTVIGPAHVTAAQGFGTPQGIWAIGTAAVGAAWFDGSIDEWAVLPLLPASDGALFTAAAAAGALSVWVDQVEGAIGLAAATSLDSLADFDAAPTIDTLGGVLTRGVFYLDATESVLLSSIAPVRITASTTVETVPQYPSFDDIPDLDAEAVVDGSTAPWTDWALEVAQLGSPMPEVDDAGFFVFGPWSPLKAGVYNTAGVKFRIVLTSRAATAPILLTGASVTVDVPDRVETGTATPVGVGVARAFTPVKKPDAASVDIQVSVGGADVGTVMAVAFATPTAQYMGVTDSRGNTYAVYQPTQNPAVAGVYVALATVSTALVGGDRLTVTCADGVARPIAASAFVLTGVTLPLDQAKGVSGTIDAGGTASIGPTAPLAQAGDLVVAVWGLGLIKGETVTPTAGQLEPAPGAFNPAAPLFQATVIPAVSVAPTTAAVTAMATLASPYAYPRPWSGIVVALPPAPIPTAIQFARVFNAIPNLQATARDAQAGDRVLVSNVTRFGATLSVQNSGVAVPRVVDWIAQGY